MMPLKILLVDDEAGIRNVLSIYIKDIGFDVVTADDGEKALSIMNQGSIDIVLTDIRMPGLDGISLLKHIKANKPETEVIMLTGHGDYELAIKSLKLDAVDFISKPINNDVLDIALKRAVDRIESRKKIKAYTLDLEDIVKEKTKKLEASQKRYLQLFDESPSFLTIQDKDYNIVETNQLFKTHFNFHDNMTCYAVYKGRTAPCKNCPVKKTFKDGKSHTAEMDVILKDGSKKNILIQTSAIKDEFGVTTHVLEMSTDVTVIRTLQDHLVALGLHIGSISHGLKQLVTGLDGGAYLIESGLDKKDTPLISEGWDIVKDKISQTRQMVMNILYHAKKRKPELSNVLLAVLIREAITAIQTKADQEQIELIWNIPETRIVLHIDQIAIMTALCSILDNAIDACLTSERKGCINFITQVKSNHIQFTIQDNGKGLSDDEKEKIFDLFYSSKGNKGTGLGLFIASRTIQQHGGDIRVESEKNYFTRVIITLPINKNQTLKKEVP